MSLRNKISVLVAVVLSFFTDALFAAQPGEFGDTASGGSGVWMSILFYAVLIILIGQALGIIGRIFQVYELSTEAAGTKRSIPWNAINGGLFLIMLIAGLYFSIWEIKVHGALTLPAAASEHGKNWDSMFKATFLITLGVFIITHILLLGFAYKYRQRKGHKAFFYPHNDRLEIVWTSVPAVVLTLLVVFGWVNWTRMTDPARQAEDQMVVEVVGRQFNWMARYPGSDGELGPRNYKLINSVNALGIDFASQASQDDILPSEIVLPVGKPVKMIFGALDVIHSAYIPTLRVQMNTVPGMPTFFYFTPTVTTEEMRQKLGDAEFNYLLYCNKICGSSHYNMSMKVIVVTEVEYQQWLQEQQPFYSGDMKEKLQSADAGNGQASPANNSLALNIN